MKYYCMSSLIFLFLALLPDAHAQSNQPIPAVFYATQGYDYQIATLSPDTFQITPVCDVAEHSLTNVTPAPSPDGRSLALTMFAGDFGIADYTFFPHQQNSFIYLCDLTTGTAERLSLPDTSILDSSPSFSPDGTQLAWLRIAESDDLSEPDIQVIVYDRQARTETVIATLNTIPTFGISSNWVEWGPGGIAVVDHVDGDLFEPVVISIYTPQGELIIDSNSIDPPLSTFTVREWALSGNQPVYILSAQPRTGNTRGEGDRYTVLNTASAEAEITHGNPTKATLNAGDNRQVQVRYLPTHRIDVELLNAPYRSMYGLAVAPDEEGLLVIDFSTMLRGGQLYYVDATDLPHDLGAFHFPVRPIDIPGIIPGEGGVLAVYWQVDTWQFSP